MELQSHISVHSYTHKQQREYQNMDDYQDRVLDTLASDSHYYGEYVDNEQFQRDVFGFVACSARLEQHKKTLFYGKNLPKFPTINPVRTTDSIIQHAKLGIAGEAGELFDAEGREEIKNEAGDLLWFLSVLLSKHDLTFDEVMRGNIDKLRKKYSGGKFTREEALNPRIR